MGRAARLINHQVHCQVVLKQADGGVAVHSGDECALDFGAGQVCGVNDAAVAVAALTCEVQGAVFVACEVGAQLRQLQHTGGALAAHDLHSPVQRGAGWPG